MSDVKIYLSEPKQINYLLLLEQMRSIGVNGVSVDNTDLAKIINLCPRDSSDIIPQTLIDEAQIVINNHDHNQLSSVELLKKEQQNSKIDIKDWLKDNSIAKAMVNYSPQELNQAINNATLDQLREVIKILVLVTRHYVKNNYLE